MMSETEHTTRHLRMRDPSSWFCRFQPLIKAKGSLLDVAAGGGRHVRHFCDAGFRVTAVDQNIEPLSPFADTHGAEIIQANLESGAPWPLDRRNFDAVIVCNYLFRPLFDDLLRALATGGVLLYETFALGNEVFSRPRNPDHLLRSGELLSLVEGRLQVIAYQHGIVDGGECPGVKQMICAVNNLQSATRQNGQPDPLALP